MEKTIAQDLIIWRIDGNQIYDRVAWKKTRMIVCKRLQVVICEYIYASWTHGLIAQSVRASERNLAVVGSNPTQANFL